MQASSPAPISSTSFAEVARGRYEPGRLVVLIFALGALGMMGCERLWGEQVDPDIARRHAEVRGQYQAALVIDLSREMVLIHPMSERSKSARRARVLLDAMENQIVPWPKTEEEVREETGPGPFDRDDSPEKR